MLSVIVIMSAGMFLGFILRKKEKLVKLTAPVTTASIFALLFLLGVSVGTNRTIFEHLDKIGLKAAVLTFGAVTGSIVLSYFVYRCCFCKNER